MSDASIVEYFAEHEHFKCGYCGSPDTNYSHGMWAHTMTTQDYQELIDRGWRRSGKYCYKPTMAETCCPQYAIRCDVADFKLSRSQKKVIKRVTKYLNTGERNAGNVGNESGDRTGVSEVSHTRTATAAVGVDGVQIKGGETKGKGAEESKPNVVTSGSNIAEKSGSEGDRVVPTRSEGDAHRKEPKKPKPGRGADPDMPGCKKSKAMRLERWQAKQALKCGDIKQREEVKQKKEDGNREKSLEDYLNDVSQTPAHKLEIKLVRSYPNSIPFEARFDESYAIYKKYQMTIHGDPPSKPSQSQFKRFLVDSPLEPMHREGGSESGFGSFHQHYLLDGALIGVGVLDILPYCVSSVYFYYDPAFAFLSLGTYSALREVAFTRHLRTMEPSIEQYYMGFYIHSCRKMRYKGQLTASFLLCPETYTWHPYKQCVPKLDASKYCRFTSPEVVDEDSDIDLKSVLVLTMRQKMPYFIYKSLCPDKTDEKEVKEYAGLVGRTCAKRMLLYRE